MFKYIQFYILLIFVQSLCLLYDIIKFSPSFRKKPYLTCEKDTQSLSKAELYITLEGVIKINKSANINLEGHFKREQSLSWSKT